MGLGDISLACARALVDELVGGGVRHACLSPGSRSTPLALALARDPRIQVDVHLDERASAFFALGLAKASGEPVALACTSGTAAAEFLPAVVEASQSRTPLVLLTADRPPRLRGTGANQTIDQVNLYGRYARAYVEPPVPSRREDAAEWRAAARRALEETNAHPPGPVHVNCPFEEPLTPEGEDVEAPPTKAFDAVEVRKTSFEPTHDQILAFMDEIWNKRGVVVAGGGPQPASEVESLARIVGWPILAEPQSGLRRPGLSISTGRSLVDEMSWTPRRMVRVALQVGAAPTTRAMRAFVSSVDKLIVVDYWHLEPDPEGKAHMRLRVDPDALAVGAEETKAAPRGWLQHWIDAESRVRPAIDSLMDDWDEPFEPRIARDLADWIPDGGTLFVGNSTPVRDLDLAMRPRRRLRVMANRGASGIDGLVATTLGMAHEGSPTFALLGDLSFLYDAGALLWSGREEAKAVFVVISNGGGQVFSLLPQRALPEHQELFVARHPARIADVCDAAGVPHTLVESAAELIPAVQRASGRKGIQVIEVRVDPELGKLRRDEMRAAASEALLSS